MSNHLCPDCGRDPSATPFGANKSSPDGIDYYCKECKATRARNYYLRNQSVCIAKVIARKNANREVVLAKQRAHYHATKHLIDREDVAAYKRQHRQKPEVRARYEAKVLALKLEVFNAYGGPVCVCCNEKNVSFLTLDHVFSDGHKHRKTAGAHDMYTWAKKNNYPPIFQVLCMNCNWGRATQGKGICPHELERQQFNIITLAQEARAP